MEWNLLTQTRNVRSVTKISPTEYLSVWHILGNCRSSEGLRSFKPSKETNLITLLILAGDIEMNPGTTKKIARHRLRLSNARTVKSTFTHHAPNLETMSC